MFWRIWLGDAMIESDCHVHTEFSNDCDANIEQQIEKAIELGLEFICITDHCDMDYPSSQEEKEYMLNTESYIYTLDFLKEKYQKKNKNFMWHRNRINALS